MKTKKHSKFKPGRRRAYQLIAASILTAVALVGTRLLYAATATLYLAPATATVTQNSTFNVAVRLNTNGESVRAIQTTVGYDQSKLQYLSFSNSGSAFPQSTGSNDSNGFHFTGSSPGVTGDLLITTITFKALAASGSTSASFSSNVVVNTSNQLVSTSTSSGTYSFTGASSPPAPPPSSPPSSTPAPQTSPPPSSPLPISPKPTASTHSTTPTPTTSATPSPATTPETTAPTTAEAISPVTTTDSEQPYIVPQKASRVRMILLIVGGGILVGLVGVGVLLKKRHRKTTSLGPASGVPDAAPAATLAQAIMPDDLPAEEPPPEPMEVIAPSGVEVTAQPVSSPPQKAVVEAPSPPPEAPKQSPPPASTPLSPTPLPASPSGRTSSPPPADNGPVVTIPINHDEPPASPTPVPLAAEPSTKPSPPSTPPPRHDSTKYPWL